MNRPVVGSVTSVIGRIPILDLEPAVDCGARPAKAVAGETFAVSATVFREGHGLIGVGAVLRDPERNRGPLVRMRELAPGTDRYGADVTVTAEGLWRYHVEAWADPIASWHHDAAIKIPAGQDVELMLTEGALLFGRAARRIPQPPGASRPAAARTALRALVALLRDRELPPEQRLAGTEDPAIAAILERWPLRDLVTRSRALPVQADRERALYGSWYELFPRSEGALVDPTGQTPPVSGTLRTAARRLDAVADMGFDVVYLPPVHPIGNSFRKGRNNTLNPEDGDPGSPWAIGSADGGHDSIHPDLGTFEDFDAFVARTRELGMEVALDLALNASPDHPWVKEHPEWFTTRADGSIAYAENPPKKYQDIYPLNFDNDPEGIYAEVLRVVRLWMDHGVTDLPGGQPAHQAAAVLGAAADRDPGQRPGRAVPGRGVHPPGHDARPGQDRLPPVLHVLHLAQRRAGADRVRARAVRPRPPPTCGPTSSPTRRTSCTSTCSTAGCPRSRSGPCWPPCSPRPGVSTPGTSCARTSRCGRAARSTWIRRNTSTGRATGTGAAGIGFGIADFITELNRIRRAHPALHWLRNLRFHHVDQPELMCFSKRTGRSRQAR